MELKPAASRVSSSGPPVELQMSPFAVKVQLVVELPVLGSRDTFTTSLP